jgi:6-pyruvoyltetrahydropterin/6-carboxytetrahydropterin synthase
MPTPAPDTIELSRTVRFCVPLGSPAPTGDDGRHNTFAAWPSMRGLGAYYELTVTCRGAPDPRTGYLLNISGIDDAVRTVAIPLIEAAVAARDGAAPAGLLPTIARRLAERLEPVVTAVRWRLTPFYSVGLEGPTMETGAMDQVVIRQQFEFAAAHRLHCPDLDEAENRRIFGKCNNPRGHGHNYRLEVAVAVPVEPAAGAMGLVDLERLVDEHVIRRFDHTNLNLDTEEFAGTNPSIENIARVCHRLLADPVDRGGGRLVGVTVWETEKTCCTYPAPGAATGPAPGGAVASGPS